MSEAVEQIKPSGIPTPEELGFDPAVIRAKYTAERQIWKQDGSTKREI